MKITATKIIEFDAAHRLLNHESKCRNIHGHRYKVEFFAEAEMLDDLGRVVDFGVLKEKIKPWIDEHFDHNTILNESDGITYKAICSIPQDKTPYLMDSNPTAENMGLHLLMDICPVLLEGTDVSIHKIRIWETPSCFIDVEL